MTKQEAGAFLRRGADHMLLRTYKTAAGRVAIDIGMTLATLYQFASMLDGIPMPSSAFARYLELLEGRRGQNERAT